MRTCIFCGNQALTKEDAWPLWLVKLLKNKAGRIEATRGKQETKIWHVANPEIKVRHVCSNCNNGWMSDLETRAKPIIEQLLGKDRLTLDAASQGILAKWSVKNSMVFEALRLSSSSFYVEVERRALKESLQLPSITSVWIAKSVKFESFFSKASDLEGIITASNNIVKSYVTTMGFGSLAIQVLCSKLPNLAGKNIAVDTDMNPEWEHATLQIWPVRRQRVVWPPALGLSGEFGLESFSQRWIQK